MNEKCFGAILLSISLGVSGYAQTLSVTNGLTLQFKADGSLFADQAGTIAATDGSTVGLWKDEVGSIFGGDVFQTDGSGLQPTYHGVINGLPVVRFDGANDVLVNGLAMTAFLGLTDWTSFAVFQARSVSATGAEGYNSQAVWMDSGQNLRMPVRFDTGTPKVMGYSYSGINPPAQTFDTNQFTFAIASLTNGLVSIQAASPGAGDPGTPTSATGGNTTGSGLRIGKGQPFLDGDIAELLFYNRTLTTEERASVTTYLNDKYALGILAVPEPSTAALFAVAICAILRRRFNRT